MNSIESFFNDDPWGEILSPCYPEGRRLYIKDDRFWVAKDSLDRIMFFVHEPCHGEIKCLENLDGVEVKIEQYLNDECRLCCTLLSYDASMREKFAVVAKDIAYYCTAFNGAQLFLKVQDRIKSWANFLKPTREGLSQSEYVGLWGELYAVSELLMNAHAADDAVRFWIGPEGKKQDITLNTIAVDVKTSMSGDPQTIKISSLDQLAKVTDTLYILRLVASPSNGIEGLSLQDLYLNCMNALSHNMIAETLFLQKTAELYGKANKGQLEGKYVISTTQLFEVDDAFPTITHEKVANEIVKATYEISLAGIKDSEVQRDIIEILKNG
jgi:hypothetical protein